MVVTPRGSCLICVYHLKVIILIQSLVLVSSQSNPIILLLSIQTPRLAPPPPARATPQAPVQPVPSLLTVPPPRLRTSQSANAISSSTYGQEEVHILPYCRSSPCTLQAVSRLGKICNGGSWQLRALLLLSASVPSCFHAVFLSILHCLLIVQSYPVL